MAKPLAQNFLVLSLITLSACRDPEALKTMLLVKSPSVTKIDMITYESGDNTRLETTLTMQQPGVPTETVIKSITVSDSKTRQLHSQSDGGKWTTSPKPSREELAAQAEQSKLVLTVLTRRLEEIDTDLKTKKLKEAKRIELEAERSRLKAQRFGMRRSFGEMLRTGETVDQAFLPTQQTADSPLGPCQIFTSAVQTSLKDEHCLIPVEKTPLSQKEFQERTERQLKETPYNPALLLTRQLEYKFYPVWTRGYEDGELMMEVITLSVQKVRVSKNLFAKPETK